MDGGPGQCRGRHVLNCALDRSRSALGERIDWREQRTGQHGDQGQNIVPTRVYRSSCLGDAMHVTVLDRFEGSLHHSEFMAAPGQDPTRAPAKASFGIPPGFLCLERETLKIDIPRWYTKTMRCVQHRASV